MSFSISWFCRLMVCVLITVRLPSRAARTAGMARGEASALGILMNTRGLMELVVLNIGYDLGIIPPVLFSMLIVMALATTLMTGPLLDRALKGRESF